MLAIIRQLAEAERSPRAAIEEEYEGIRRSQSGQSSRYCHRVRELKIRYGLAHHRKFAKGHTHELAIQFFESSSL